MENSTKEAEDYEQDRVEKYVQYFNSNAILPIPELTKEFEPQIVFFVVSDNKTRRPVGLRREAFKELLRAAGVPCKYFCKRSFTMWDILRPTPELAAKLAGGTLITRNYRLQPEYMGTHRIRVTVCNVPTDLSGDMLTVFLSSYGKVEDVSPIITSSGLIHRDYVFKLCLKRDGFQASNYKDRQLIVVVEGKRSFVWSCKQVGYLAKFYPQRSKEPN